MKKLTSALVGAGAIALATAAAASAFSPTNPYYAKQWYLAQDNAFEAWSTPPVLQPVTVGIVDSGVDCSLPDLAGRILATRSFVGGSACSDTEGHGTIVAGEIAANLGTTGIVGLAYTSQLVVAKVVKPDGTIPVRAEARAIRWVVDQGARVVNLSFGAVRDPRVPALDSYSRIEAQAVAYAQARGALVVAAAGNADEAYSTPWPYASWPAALPHVLGVGALNRSGGVPSFSDRDPIYVDLAAPGTDIFSTFPTALTGVAPSCVLQGYTACAAGDYAHPQGTSFAAPQVAAAAAVLLGLDPTLTSSQLGWILERSTDDVNPSTGCAVCFFGRDKFSGRGRLDVANAVAVLESGAYPPPDRMEPNDDPAHARRLRGRAPSFTATLDYWDDPVDIYRVHVSRTQRLVVRARARWAGAKIRVFVLPHDAAKPLRGGKSRRPAARSLRAGRTQLLTFHPKRAGWYYVEVRTSRQGGGVYALKLTKPPARRPNHQR